MGGSDAELNAYYQSTMKLERFISETLVGIANGVDEARAALQGRGAIVNPAYPGTKAESLNRHEVEFDVAVTVGKEVAGEAVGSVVVFSGSASTSLQQEVVSRVSFRVALHLPTGIADRPTMAPRSSGRRAPR